LSQCPKSPSLTVLTIILKIRSKILSSCVLEKAQKHLYLILELSLERTIKNNPLLEEQKSNGEIRSAGVVPKITPRYIWNIIGLTYGHILAYFAVTFYGLPIGRVKIPRPISISLLIKVTWIAAPISISTVNFIQLL
jgi:hypothetical protein